MAERLDLTAPITTPNVTTYSVIRVTMDFPAAYIRTDLLDSLGTERSFVYTGAAATSLMLTLNKANLSTKSLHRRIIEKLQGDGLLPSGTINGTPD